MEACWLTVRSIVRVLQDSTRTEDLLIAEQTTSQAAFRQAVRRMRQSDAGRALLAERPEIIPSQVDYAALRQLPIETLGGAYVRHLDRNGLSPDVFAAPNPYVSDPDVDYLLRRYRQSHDVWHALTSLGAQPHEEVVIHAFTFAQLHLPYSVLIVALGGIKHLVLEGRWATLSHSLALSYVAGRRAAYLLNVRWEDHWAEPIAAVRHRYGIVPFRA
ncbi:MAG: hypothetical protein H7338_09880 [Candidatus Sericytochromatia bacterium]|nr:hypothetical protein [Candidatus Sericytochromatia bacterium]